MKNFLEEMLSIIKSILEKCWNWIMSLFNHLETVAILGLAATGAASLLENIPELLALSAFFEAPFIPVIAGILAVMGLVGIMTIRKNFKKEKVNIREFKIHAEAA